MLKKFIPSENFKKKLTRFFLIKIEFAKSIKKVQSNSLVFFPYEPDILCCGICALVAFKGDQSFPKTDLEKIADITAKIKETTFDQLISHPTSFTDLYLGGNALPDDLFKKTEYLRTETPFFDIFSNPSKRKKLEKIKDILSFLIKKEKQHMHEKMGAFAPDEFDAIAARLEKLQDTLWCIKKEIIENIEKIKTLSIRPDKLWGEREFINFKRINAILNSLDRLEVRGRDSAGISILYTLTKKDFDDFRKKIINDGLEQQLRQRTGKTVLTNNCISIHASRDQDNVPQVAISIVYKFAAEIGSLGDNVAFIRTQIRNDQILQCLCTFKTTFDTVCAHTRWASVGDITEANCHPVDNESIDNLIDKSGIIHVSLNGDIDNYLELRSEYEARYGGIDAEITTDTKIIPLQIDHYLNKGADVPEAFRLALNDFKGSHAISMHTDKAPGKLFLAQKGSGQAIFVGLARDHYITASELYGIVGETQAFIKLNGEKKGQILILDQKSGGGISGMTSMSYDGTPITINQDDIQFSEITSRDIDRQDYPHYFLKEISESPISVQKTLQNKWKASPDTDLYTIILDNSTIPELLADALKKRKIKHIYFIGQGTAGIAAQGCAGILNHYLFDSGIDVRAMKSSELSGFSIRSKDENEKSMIDFLIIAVSQSGTTTDTNRTVDMVRARGAKTLAIVNRRDSDLTFKTDGVFYTSSGRDIEMSVASTKAFYSQITAGAILGLHIASIMDAITPETLTREIAELTALPDKMRTILLMQNKIKESAKRLSVSKNYWATVGSGANKTSADEIRIKLSELCYKTISSDFVEDKKHIDLSSEPLIFICAAGTRESVLKDIIKDTAIFHAHKASPVVITDEEEDRFDPYALDIFKIPRVAEHFAPVLNTLVGHLWGYYAALSINESSEFIFAFLRETKALINEYQEMGHDVYEVVLESRFREKIASFYNAFSKRRRENKFPAAMDINNAANITLLLKYLSGRLPVADFEIDFDKKGTPSNMLDEFFKNMSEAVNNMSRPVDAIKHQAKTVTVGTSRTAEKFEGIIFDELASNNIMIAQITHRNVLVIKNLQEIISKINGALLYKISGLNLLGEPTRETKIEVMHKTGTLICETSRVETEPRLKGTKNIIVREGNVYIGKGRKDGKRILVIPVLSSSPSSSFIEYLFSMNVSFKDISQVSLLKRIKALGGKYQRIKDITLESNGFAWDDTLLDLIGIENLFGDSAEKIADAIVSKKKMMSKNDIG